MDTPICDFVKEYADSGRVRLHMPGHKGKPGLGLEALDITEIAGADVLYGAEGIIARSAQNAARLFGTAKTLYSVEGSSLCIRAMLYLTALYAKAEGKRPLIAAGRNAHKVFMTAAALLDFDILWLYPENGEGMLSCTIDADSLDKMLWEAEEKPVAVYITSPDYLGNLSDIGKIAQVCRKWGILLLVDNAHGAYLRFLPEDTHPITLGADICCDSAHKTLPVLTGGAYLHIAHRAPERFCRMAENALSVFASTSPSYLILQSLDAANRYLAKDYSNRLTETVNRLCRLKTRLMQAGYTTVGNEPLKLTLAVKDYGYTGYAFAEILSDKGIECEFCDPDFVVMMLTPENEVRDFERLETGLLEIAKRESISQRPPQSPRPQKAMSAKNALFSPQERLEVQACRGRILAAANVSCPPAVPVAVCGERIDQAVIECFAYYGIKKCDVVKE
ncbi:MAG: PLP-dependent transferase [Clostridia bacterium]|nr:PLP-dependent transferase [Clostridia bacterium]